MCCFFVFAGKQPAWQVRLGPQQCSWTSPAAAGSDRCGDLENVALWAMNLMESIDVAVWALFRLTIRVEDVTMWAMCSLWLMVRSADESFNRIKTKRG